MREDVVTTTSSKSTCSSDIQFLYEEIRRVEYERDNYKAEKEKIEHERDEMSDLANYIFERLIDIGCCMPSEREIMKMKKDDLKKSCLVSYNKYKECLEMARDRKRGK